MQWITLHQLRPKKKNPPSKKSEEVEFSKKKKKFFELKNVMVFYTRAALGTTFILPALQK